jgi:hypothetical protein
MSDNSSRLAMYEMYMTELQSTSHFFIFEMASNEKVVKLKDGVELALLKALVRQIRRRITASAIKQ